MDSSPSLKCKYSITSNGSIMTFIDRNIVTQEINRLQMDTDFQKVVSNIKAGKFVRDTNLPDYNDRIIYTKALRNFLYNPAVLNVVFGEQELKEQFFRAFGYTGKVNFTIYPKCWLRDLPLLDIGENVYLGDNILLGTNQVTPDQKTLVVGKLPLAITAFLIRDVPSEEKPVLEKMESLGLKPPSGSEIRSASMPKSGNA